MYLFYVLLFSIFITLLAFIIGQDHPNLFIFINLFVSIVTLVYMIFQDYGKYLIINPLSLNKIH